jgi:hypothetical protein
LVGRERESVDMCVWVKSPNKQQPINSMDQINQNQTEQQPHLLQQFNLTNQNQKPNQVFATGHQTKPTSLIQTTQPNQINNNHQQTQHPKTNLSKPKPKPKTNPGVWHRRLRRVGLLERGQQTTQPKSNQKKNNLTYYSNNRPTPKTNSGVCHGLL